MIFPSKDAFELVAEFAKLPQSREKDAISDRYLSDEISVEEFRVEARKYLAKLREENAK